MKSPVPDLLQRPILSMELEVLAIGSLTIYVKTVYCTS